MVLYCTYCVRFCLNGKTKPQTKRYRAHTLGEAFQKCHREFPGARLIEGWRQGERNGERAITHYEAPSSVAVIPGPKNTAEQTAFRVADQLSFKPRESSWRWGAPASQSKPSSTQN
jgi:hypothetical protein